MRDSASAFVAGIKLNILQFSELEDHYARYAENIKQNGLNLGDWLPSFNNCIRPLVPGELVFFLGGTGVGKTAILSHCATITKMPTLFFELELPAELMFERVLAMKAKRSCQFVEDAYRTGERFGTEYLDSKFGHLFICTESRLKVSDIENTIMRAELKMGQRPKLVLIDYVGLINGTGGSRYEKVSQIAEDLKVMAKATQTIVICASQISRKGKDDTGEVGIADGKDSGSIENSAGLVIGAWRDVEDRSLMHMRVLKNTKGIGGKQITCNYNGELMSITERSPVQP
jgi:replicative DNA helicase